MQTESRPPVIEGAGSVAGLSIELPTASQGPYVSVVVPVYNTERYLDECLGSLAAQTLDNIEIVCVNDGSTDSSRDKLARWQAEDGRIRIIDKGNGGVSSARNAGIRAARASIVTFLDSDDRFMPDACETILAAMLATGADVLTFGATVFPATNVDPWIIEHLSPPDAVFEGFDPSLILKPIATPYIRTALRRQFMLDRSLLFDEVLDVGEDELFLVQAYTLSKRTVLLSDKLYGYRQNDASLTHAIDVESAERCLKHLAVADRVFGHWSQMFGDDDEATAVALEWAIGYVLYGIFALPNPDRSQLAAHAGALLKKHWPQVVLRQARLSGLGRAVLDLLLAGKPVGDARALALRLRSHLTAEGLAATAASMLRALAR